MSSRPTSPRSRRCGASTRTCRARERTSCSATASRTLRTLRGSERAGAPICLSGWLSSIPTAVPRSPPVLLACSLFAPPAAASAAAAAPSARYCRPESEGGLGLDGTAHLHSNSHADRTTAGGFWWKVGPSSHCSALCASALAACLASRCLAPPAPPSHFPPLPRGPSPRTAHRLSLKQGRVRRPPAARSARGREEAVQGHGGRGGRGQLHLHGRQRPRHRHRHGHHGHQLGPPRRDRRRRNQGEAHGRRESRGRRRVGGPFQRTAGRPCRRPPRRPRREGSAAAG